MPGGSLNRDVLYPNMSYSVTERVRTFPCSSFMSMNIVLNLLHQVSTAECLPLSNHIISSGGWHVFLPLVLSFPRAHGSAIQRQDFSSARSHRVPKATWGSARLVGCRDWCQAVQNFTLHHSCMPGLLIKMDRSTVALLLNSSLLNISGKVSRPMGTQVLPKWAPALWKRSSGLQRTW